MSLISKLIKNDKAEMGDLMGAIIVGVIVIVVALVLGNALLPSAVTGISNTTAITGYSTWSTGTQSMWTAVPIFGILAFLLLIIAVVLVVVKKYA